MICFLIIDWHYNRLLIKLYTFCLHTSLSLFNKIFIWQFLKNKQEHLIYRFNTRAELSVHNDTHPNSHLCHMCGKGCKNKAILRAHMFTHNNPNTHLCHICGQGFKSQVSLALHFKHHNPDLKFQCDQCPSAFQQRYRLDLHKKVRHLMTREYKCTICEKKFSYKANLKSHYG